MISIGELIAGLTFLEIHAPDDRMKLSIKHCQEEVLSLRKELQLEELRASKAEDLELSVRALNCIAKCHLLTVGAVELFMMNHTDSELCSGEFRRNFWGKKVAKEIRLLLKELGLELEHECPFA